MKGWDPRLAFDLNGGAPKYCPKSADSHFLKITFFDFLAGKHLVCGTGPYGGVP
jgi:hypothetical protein